MVLIVEEPWGAHSYLMLKRVSVLNAYTYNNIVIEYDSKFTYSAGKGVWWIGLSNLRKRHERNRKLLKC